MGEVIASEVELVLGLGDHLQLYLADESVVKFYVDQDIPCFFPQPILYPQDLKPFWLSVTNVFHFLEDFDYFFFLRAHLAPQQVPNLEGN